MSDLQACSIRDNFLITLNNCRNEINAKFKQISDNLIFRQNQLLTELDGIEKKYSESRSGENLIKQTEKCRNKQNESLRDSFLPENIISSIKLIIASLDIQIYNLKQNISTFTNIDIELDTDNINTLIDKLGSVILTEDSEYNSCLDYITDTCHIDPCESYNPNNNTISTDTIGNKIRKQGNVFSNKSPIKSVASIPETGIPDSQYSSYKQSMVQYNTPFNIIKNECPVDSAPDRPLVYRTQTSSIFPGTTTQVKANHQSAAPNQFSKQTSDINISIRSRSVSSKDYAAGNILGSLTGISLESTIEKSRRENNKREDSEFETLGKYDECPLSPTLHYKSDIIDVQDCYKIEDKELNSSSSISPTTYKYSPRPISEKSFLRSYSKQSYKASERSADTYSRTNSTTSSINDSLDCSNEDNFNQVRNSSLSISSSNLTLQDIKTDVTIEQAETVNFLGGISPTDKKKKNRKNKNPLKWPKGNFM